MADGIALAGRRSIERNKLEVDERDDGSEEKHLPILAAQHSRSPGEACSVDLGPHTARLVASQMSRGLAPFRKEQASSTIPGAYSRTIDLRVSKFRRRAHEYADMRPDPRFVHSHQTDGNKN